MYSRKAGFVLMIGDFKGLILGPRQFLKSSFKMLKVLSVLEIFTFFLTFWLCKKRLDDKVKFNSKIYDVTSWAPNNYNTHIAQYLKK